GGSNSWIAHDERSFCAQTTGKRTEFQQLAGTKNDPRRAVEIEWDHASYTSVDCNFAEPRPNRNPERPSAATAFSIAVADDCELCPLVSCSTDLQRAPTKQEIYKISFVRLQPIEFCGGNGSEV